MTPPSTGGIADVTIERNKALLRRFFEEFWNHRRPETLDELLAPETTLSLAGQPQTHSIAEWKAILGHWWETFPDLRFSMDGKFVEAWEEYDSAGQLRQLGLVPASVGYVPLATNTESGATE